MIRALEFYVGALGLQKRVEFGNGYRWIEVPPAGAETTIAIAPAPDGKSAGGVQTGISLHAEDIDGYHASLKERGADVDAEVS